MRLRLQDGYTLSEKTESRYTEPGSGREWPNLPVIEFQRRPPTNAALYDLSFDQMSAKTGRERLMIQAKFIADHLASWDVEQTGKWNKPGVEGMPFVAPITPETVAAIPDPIFAQLLSLCMRWMPKPDTENGVHVNTQEESEKN